MTTSRQLLFFTHMLMLRVLTCACTLASAAFAQGVITTVVGTDWVLSANGTLATNVPLSKTMYTIAGDAQGNVYIPDGDNEVVFKIGPGNIMQVVAGNGLAGFSGDGGPATNASLNFPSAIAIDRAGNLYIADGSNYRIRKVGVDGNISTFAGTGLSGYSGDGGPALLASFGYVDCLAFDPSNNLIVCDQGNERIRKISTAGIVSTVAGNGQAGYSGDGGLAVSASIRDPQGVASDARGQLYIAEFGNNIIRRVAVDGIISTYAGNGKAGFSGDGGPAAAAMFRNPGGLAMDESGNLYVSDTDNSLIRTVNPSGIVNTIAGNGTYGFSGDGGLLLQASLYFPNGLAFDSKGRLLVVDDGNGRVRAITLGSSLQTIAGNGLFRYTPNKTPAARAFLFYPSGVAVDGSGGLYIADTDNHVVLKMTPDGLIQTVAGSGVYFHGLDGVPATSAGLNFPRGLTIAPNGDLIIADRWNHQVHRVGADGIIHLIAGSPNAIAGYGGDGGPATQALLNLPSTVAYDSAGNLYIADEGNNRIRRISNNSSITTIAGTGLADSFGDGQAATAASLNTPTAVGVDRTGSVYIGEYYGHRIRKVTPDGKISTLAGTGAYGSSGDGGPSANATVGNVYEMTVDAQGNLYFSEAYPGKVRKITPDGTITTIAGNGQQGFSGDRGLATTASLNTPSGLAIGADGAIYIADTGNHRIRMLPTGTPSFSASVSQLSFNVTSAGGLSSPQSIALGASFRGLPFNGLPFVAPAFTTSGGEWLKVTPASGTMPAVIEVGIDSSALSPGTYQGVIQISAPGASPSLQTVAVNLTVTAANPGKLTLGNQTNRAFSVTQGSASTSAQLSVSNQGGGAIAFAATASTSSGGSWLQVSPASGSVTPTTPASLTVTATPGDLGAGTYSGSIVVSSSTTGESIAVPVTMSISAAQQKILLSQTGLTFIAVQQGGTPLPQSFGILNTGKGSMGWSATASTLSGGSWLSIDQKSGTVSTPFTDVSLANVSIDLSGLATNTYYGLIQVTSPGAANSPQSVSVVLNVLPPGSNPGAEVQPTGLIFIGAPGNSPGSQNVLVSNPQGSPITFGGNFFTVPTGGNWVQFLPTNATVPPNAPARIVVQPDYTNLASGVYQGFVSFGFLDGSSRSVHILSVVAPPGGAGSASPAGGPSAERAASGCTALLVHPTALTDPSSSVSVGQPASLQARVVDNCGNLVTTGSLTATFTNGDATVNLVHVGAGNWSGTWTPRNASQSRVVIRLTAFAVQGIQTSSGTASVPVSLQTGSSAPVTLGAANAASGVGTFISPGGLVSIYGMQLADSPGGGGNPPFPTQVNGTQVLMGGKALPLRYVGSGQVNAQVPFDLTPDAAQQLVVQRGTTWSVPQDVVVAAAQPAVYTQDQQGILGSGVGVIVSGNTNALITPANPAKAGDVAVMYCNGLGAVVADGPLFKTANRLTVTIGGVEATVQFAGLAPGYPDLYQVNAVVPPGVQAGSAVPVVLNIAGQTSPPVTMAVR
jgi:uncharacterized protein (TIGR03437 family)